MLKVSTSVEKLVLSSEVTLSALTSGQLNLTAYARSILPAIKEETKKAVKLGSIVTALSRLSRTVTHVAPLVPRVVLLDVAVRLGLCELVYNRTEENLIRLRNIYHNQKLRTDDVLAMSVGTDEVTVFATNAAILHIRRYFGSEKPKVHLDGLGSLTVRFSNDYIKTPNVIFALVRSLAVRRINIVEIISAYTELTFILQEADLTRALEVVTNDFRDTSSARS
ncbi:MAG: hypothetical protein WC817_02145 [Patescibacteria group bacterium]|jgi:hypothetical protein